ncbi:MAG: carbohydrate binding domain-containing protein [Chitinophagaceae bacterium]|nr:carbohydrate binding domain-containing protein [Chitinophagaceae bacterium]
MKTIQRMLALLAAGLLSFFPASPQNLLTDGGFNTTSSITPYYTGLEPLNTWCSWANWGTSFTAAVQDGVCKYSITNAGTNTWDLQLVQWGFLLEKDYRYRLSFDVRADAPRSFGIFLGENQGSWLNFLGNQYSHSADAKWQTIQLDFDVRKTFPLHKLSFEMGGSSTAMYFDNIVLEKMAPLPPHDIEIIGSAVPPYDWTAGVSMQTTDGVIYTLKSYPLKAGELKLRQDKDWSVNWGGPYFPSGTAYQDGPNIPIPEGTYDISFNRETGAYEFKCIGCATSIGIIGSAVPPYNWSVDLNMQTMDGIEFTLQKAELQGGELRFRQDDSWTINWGGTTFPTGTGHITDPNIWVPAGNYDITFNRLTGAYTFKLNTPSVGILGSALGGWMEDINMGTEDGVVYTLLNQKFETGEVKFRLNDSWTINWGSNTFPTGVGWQDGPNIPVPAGTYNVYFYRQSGYYYFEQVCPPTVLICPKDFVVTTDPGSCGAFVYYAMPFIQNPCGYAMVYQTKGLPSGAFFPTGTHWIEFAAYSYYGLTATCSFSITVEDKEAPVITQVSAQPAVLWPPDHTMKNIWLNYQATDNCGPVTTQVLVSSNETENGTGDGPAGPDWQLVDDHHLMLRAERSGNSKGRIYTITIIATDGSGNATQANMQVTVPHSASPITKMGSTGVNAAAGNMPLSGEISPNPSARDFLLRIRSGTAAPVSIRVIDLAGRVMMQSVANAGQTLRIGSALPPGLYLLEMTQADQKASYRIIKQ